MITDDEVMRLFERADPARIDDADSVLDAASYLDALAATNTDATPLDEVTNRRRRWPVLAAAAAVAALIVATIILVRTASDGGGTVLSPAGPAPSAPAPAPSTAAPTPPDPGSTLVASWEQQYDGIVFIYADGRVIWACGYCGALSPPPASPTGAWERRLTAAGLDLVRSGQLAASEFVVGNVPPSAWADPEKIGWTPSEYAACLWQGTATSVGAFLGPSDTVVARLPASAKALLHTPTKEKIAWPDSPSPWPDVMCFRLTPQEVGAVRDLPQVLIPATTNTPAIGVMVFPVLPHGNLFAWGS